MSRFLLLFLLLSSPALAAQNPPDSSAPKTAPDSPSAPAKPADAKAVAAGAVVPAGKTVEITTEQWARPRSGPAIARLPDLAPLVEAFDREPANRVIVRYAGGDEGSLWAEELRSWLVALGIPSARIELEPSLPQADKLLLELRRQPSR